MAPLHSFVGRFAKAAFTVSAPRSSPFAATRHRQELLPTTAASAVSSPLLKTTPALSTGDISSHCLEKMCKLFEVTPADNLYLSTGGERGVCLRRPVKEGEVVLSIPIASCLRDDEPPAWYNAGGSAEGYDEDDAERDITDYERYGPSAWASRLAASLLDLDLEIDRGGAETDEERGGGAGDDLRKGRELWRSVLPDADLLRASLPLHWGEEVLSTGKCTALELAVDSAYFARATAVIDLSQELQRAMAENVASDVGRLQREADWDAVTKALDMGRLQRKCHDALDVVQTRSCRVERTCEDGVQWGPPLRVLAPVFDFLNHGSSRDLKADGSANAYFGIEDERMCDTHDARLVVRALRDIAEGEEVLIDYGDSARPAWRCLTSYGFVPEYDVGSEAEEVGQNPENVAELWMNGLRFEVEPSSVPFDLVEVAAAQALLDDPPDDGDGGTGDGPADPAADGGALAPPVARAIARRATEAAFNLITEPEAVGSEEDWDSPARVTAASLAALLRWSQHKVLLAFAENLELFSASSSSSEAE